MSKLKGLVTQHLALRTDGSGVLYRRLEFSSNRAARDASRKITHILRKKGVKYCTHFEEGRSPLYQVVKYGWLKRVVVYYPN